MLKALENYVVVKPDKGEEKTDSGIILPELRKNQPESGIIVDIHESNKVAELAKGVKVWYKMWAGQPTKYEKVEYLILNVKELIAYEK